MNKDDEDERSFEALEKTLGQAVTEGLVSRSEVVNGVSSFLAESDPLFLGSGAYAMLPTLDALPPRLRDAMIEIALLSRV